MLDDLLAGYRQRQLNIEHGYKPLDVGGGTLTCSVNQDGRMIALNTFHSVVGYVTLTSAPPFAEEQRYDARAVRAYRQQMTELDGYGVDFAGDIVRRKARLLEDAIPHIRLTFADGATADVITFVPSSQPQGVIQLWQFTDTVPDASLSGNVWLQRSAYTQLTEGGPAAMPDVTTRARRHDAVSSALVLENDALGCTAVIAGTHADELSSGGVHIHHTLPPTNTVTLCFTIAENTPDAIQQFDTLQAKLATELLTETLDYWRNLWTGWAYTDHPLDKLLRRGLVYSLYCAVPVTDDTVCIMTDHMLLPLSWNRDAYYCARALLNWHSAQPALVQVIVKQHLRWLFDVAERDSGAWGRAYLVNGRIKDRGYQLDQQLFPLIEYAEYVLETQDHALRDQLSPVVLQTVDHILAHKDTERWLFPTQETPADDPVAYPYHFSSHVLMWRAFTLLARLNLSANHDFIQMAQQVKNSVLANFSAPHNGRHIFAYATDGQEHYHFYHDANDIPLAMAPVWGFVGAGDSVWRATVEFAFSSENIGGTYDGRLGSVHTPAPWSLGDAQDVIIAQVLGDTSRERLAQQRMLQAAQWDGALPEAYSAESGRTVSRHWFAWTNAMLVCIYGNDVQDNPL